MNHTCPTSHQPGTRSCYVTHRCRCVDCTEANRLYYHEWNRRQLELRYGARQPKYVPAAVPRRTLERLRDDGVGLRTISRETGLSRSSLTKVIRGQRTRVLKSTARTIAEYAAPRLRSSN